MEVRTIKTCSGLLTLRFQDGALLPQSDAAGLVVRERCEPSKTSRMEQFERIELSEAQVNKLKALTWELFLSDWQIPSPPLLYGTQQHPTD